MEWNATEEWTLRNTENQCFRSCGPFLFALCDAFLCVLCGKRSQSRIVIKSLLLGNGVIKKEEPQRG